MNMKGARFKKKEGILAVKVTQGYHKNKVYNLCFDYLRLYVQSDWRFTRLLPLNRLQRFKFQVEQLHLTSHIDVTMDQFALNKAQCSFSLFEKALNKLV